MSFDTNAFTLSLFDNSTLSGLTRPDVPAVPGPPDAAHDPEEDGELVPPAASPARCGTNYHLAGDRELGRGWAARARGNIAAITLSKVLEAAGHAPTPEEQAQLLRFTGFGATDLAQNCFRRPGEDEFREGWQDIGAALEEAVTAEEYAALQRATQLYVTWN